MQVASASPDPAPTRVRPRHRWLTGAAIGLGAASVAALCVGTPVYRATAVIAVPNTDPFGRVAIVRSAAAGVVSKPVIQRAALSLSGTSGVAPTPGWWTRLLPARGGPALKAFAGEAALAQTLAGSVVASPGMASGSIEVTATSPMAEDAASMASSMADAFVAEQDESILQARRRDEAAITSRIEALQTVAIAAHRRLSDLGGNAPVDAAAARASAAAQTHAAVARRDAIKAILAAGSPPLGDGKGVPAAIEALQTIYLDQMRQLAHARETLGERHTTVIALTESVERGAAKLTTEWRRLKVAADAEVSAAHDMEDASRKGDGAADDARQTTIAEARSAAQRADAALLRAEAAAADTTPDNPFHVIARAPVPVAASGWPASLRDLLAAFAGLLAAGAWLRTTRAPRRTEAIRQDAPGKLAADKAPKQMSRAEPSARIEPEASVSPVSRSTAVTPTAEVPRRARTPEVEAQAVPSRAPEPEAPRPRTIAPQPERTVAMPNLPSNERPQADETLKQALRAILPTLGKIEPCYGALPTVMIAANEIGIGTSAAALALGHAAAEAGYRVLVVESARPRPDLAMAVDPEADPVLVDMFGGLRVALKAERSAGSLFLAPYLKDGLRIASALARGGDTFLIDDIAEEFDLLVVDGGRAADAAAEDWGADIALRVARFASARDDDRLVATLRLPSEALLGTIAGSTFLPRAVAVTPIATPPAAEDPAATSAISNVVRPFTMHRPVVQQLVQQRRPRPQAPRSTMRRRVGLR